MQVLTSAADVRAALSHARSIALVPTMGALHEGHSSLVRRAREHADLVVVSIFVNPLQFGPNEDFARYPRDLEQDLAVLNGIADAVFAPTVDAFAPAHATTYVEPPFANELCGAHRPGHFRGVATIVTKFLNVVRPQCALFGKKDYQQLVVVRRIVADLEMPVTVIGVETARAPDGLALSSRNRFLSKRERAEAPQLYNALRSVAEGLAGDRETAALLCVAASQTLVARGWKVDYVEVREAETLAPWGNASKDFVVLGAAWLGTTRLIDNIEARVAQ